MLVISCHVVLGWAVPLAAHSGSYTGMGGEASNYKECHKVLEWCVDKALVNLVHLKDS